MRSSSMRSFSGVALAAPCLVAALVASCGSKESDDALPGGNGGSSATGAVPGSGGLLISTGGTTGAPTTAPVQYDQMRPAFQYQDNESVKSWVEPGVLAGADLMFASATPGTAKPVLSYPLNNSMHPKNLANITFQWWKSNTSGTSTATEYRMNLEGGGKKYRFYFHCGAADRACSKGVIAQESQSPDAEWYQLGNEFAGQELTLTLQELDGTTLNTSDPVKIHFSPEQVLGVLYYWEASAFRIKRATFGALRATDFIVPNSPTNEFKCAACHAVSRDGSTIAFSVTQDEGESVGGIQIAKTTDPEHPTVRPTLGPTPFTDPSLTHGGEVTEGATDNFGHNVALSPDGRFAAVNGIPKPPEQFWNMYLEIRDTATGAAIRNYKISDPLFGANKLAIMPEYSPKGDFLVAHMADSSTGCAWTYSSCLGGIAVFSVAGDGSLGGLAGYVVEQRPDVIYHSPTWSPNADWVVFVASPIDSCSAMTKCVNSDPPWNAPPHLCKSDCNNSGALFMARTSGGPHVCPGPNCVELVNADTYSMADARTNGMHIATPKAAPFAQANGNIFFVTFATGIRYGMFQEGRNQLWMAAIDTSKVPSDPSYAPIWVPYQDPATENLTPYWAEVSPCTETDGGCLGCLESETCHVFEQTNICTCKADIIR